MELSTATLVGQFAGLLFLALIVYLVVLIPISLKKIAGQLSEIRDELRKKNKQTARSAED